jgi:hypothetical protein
MNLGKMLAELKKELEHVDAAIASLERLQATKRKRGKAEGKEEGAEVRAAPKAGRPPSETRGPELGPDGKAR